MAKICAIPENEVLQLEDGQVDSPLALLLGLADAFDMELHELFAFSLALTENFYSSDTSKCHRKKNLKAGVF